MPEIDNGPWTNEELAKAALLGVGKMMLLKWGVIFGVTYLLRRAAKQLDS